MKKTKTREALYKDFLYQKNANGVSLHQFFLTLYAGQYIWLLPATVPL